MIKANPLFDIEFLTKLTEKQQREIFARITVLDMNELPIEYIEGKITAGSVNVDGASAVRRTCNLTMVAKDANINEFYWGFKRKMRLEVGVKNTIDLKYPDIIWFNQGVFVITSFNITQSTNNFTITLNGKDKMCLLNGDIAGHLPHSTDFGTMENYDSETGMSEIINIPIKDILYEALCTFGNELSHNIVINDLEDAGLELLEYKGNTPMYMLKEVQKNTTSEAETSFTQMTFNGGQQCYIVVQEGDKETYIPSTIDDYRHIVYENLVDLSIAEEIPSTIIIASHSTSEEILMQRPRYNVVKFEYGHTSGYRLTDLTFPGTLIANIGETITSVLDKIKNVLGNFEYFYNIDGKFVFQKKKNYLQTTWHIGENNPDIVTDDAVNTSFPAFSFMNAELVTQFANNPNILNIRNDFSVWGVYKSITGTDIPIHMRLALDNKPECYVSPYQVDNEGNPISYVAGERWKKNSDNTETYNKDVWDWRELIYQMAKDWRKHNHDDDYGVQITRYNPQWPTGKTGYEQYYIDLEGYWRLLYNPAPEMKIMDISYEDVRATYQDIEHLLIKNPYRKYNEATDSAVESNKLYCYKDSMMYPLLASPIICLPNDDTRYYYKTSTGEMNQGTTDKDIIAKTPLEELYVFIDEKYVSYLEIKIAEIKRDNIDLLYVKENDYVSWADIQNNDIYISTLYYKEGAFVRSNKYYKYDNYGPAEEEPSLLDVNCYAEGFYTYHDKSCWSNDITDAPETLFFWFDFIDTKGGELEKYSVPVLGSRTKAINDNNVKTIYYRDIPTTIFHTVGDEQYRSETGYTYIQIPKEMESLFSISTKGKSAQERMDELLQNHSYCIENATITTVPVYHLEPNTRIYVRDDASGINGEYIVTKLTIPLTYNGTMSLTTNKVVANIM